MADYVKLDEVDELIARKPKMGHYTDYVTNTEYEKGLNINFGINKYTCESKRVVMGRTVIPPNTANERHIHLNAEAAMYIVEGIVTLFLGKEAKRVDAPPGTFIYAPEGYIHGVANADKEKEAVLIFTYGGVPSKEAAKIIFIDDSKQDYPPADWNESKNNIRRF